MDVRKSNVTSDGTNSYSYDAEGRPTTVNGVSIMYDAFGRTQEIGRNGVYTDILYAPSGQRYALMNGITVQQYYVPLAAGVQAVFNASGLQYYRHADWLGSSRFASSGGGLVIYDRAYAPYGEIYAESYETTTNRSFTGQTQDTFAGTTGNYDFLFRQQSSSQGRWLTPDPAGLAAVDITNPQTWNRYAYVMNNPLSYVDPLGLDCGSGTSSSFVDHEDGNIVVNAQGPCPNENGDRAQPPPKATILSWNFGPGPGQGGGVRWDPRLFKFGHCIPTVNGGWQCVGTGKDNGHVVTVAPPEPQYKPDCYGPAVLAGLNAAGSDFFSMPGADPASDVGDALKDKNVQRGAVGALYVTANAVKTLAPELAAAAKVVPYVGEVVLTFQALHATYEGVKAYMASVDNCYGVPQ